MYINQNNNITIQYSSVHKLILKSSKNNIKMHLKTKNMLKNNVFCFYKLITQKLNLNVDENKIKIY